MQGGERVPAGINNEQGLLVIIIEGKGGEREGEEREGGNIGEEIGGKIWVVSISPIFIIITNHYEIYYFEV